MANQRENNHGLAWLIACFLPIATLTAAPVPIDNASFEDPALSSGMWTDTLVAWTDDGPGSDLNASPGADSSFTEFIPNFSADGNQHLGFFLNGTAYQDLTTQFQPATTYTLTVHAGRRNATHTRPGNQSTYAIETTDGTVLATGSIDVSPLSDLTFTEAPEITYTSPTIGGPTGPVRIRLSALGVGRSHFDNIQLDASPNRPPSPGTATSPGDQTTIFANAGATSVATSKSPNPLVFPTNAWSVEYDPYKDKVYWSDIDTGQIRRADRNGANPETVIKIPGALLRGIQVDSLNNTIYFIQKHAATAVSNVFTSDLDGNNVQKLNPFVADFFVRPNELCLDRTNGCLFISDSGLDIVGRFDLAPTGFDIILGDAFGAPPVNGLWGLATDPETQTLYVSAYDNGDIIAVDYAGSNPQTLLTTHTLLRGLHLHPNGHILYAMDATGDQVLLIKTAPPATVTRQLFTYLNNPRDIDAFLDLDRDGDFLADFWEIDNLGDIARSDGTTNFDRDQKNELGEFAFGTDPNTPDQDVTFDSGHIDAGPAGTFAFNFLTPDSSLLNYNIYLSDDLESWALLSPGDYVSTTSASPVPGYSRRNIGFKLGSNTPRLYFQVGASTR